MKNQFSHIKGRIIISTFSSNTVRIGQIIDTAAQVNRKIIVFGKSIEKSINIATSLKYIDIPKDIFITTDELNNIEDNKLLILSTGTQGEPLASLSRIANGIHKNIKLKKGDTVIFSSSAIPGNQDKINEIINKLYKNGADVITNSPISDVHTSGHAYSNELQLMLNLVKPKFFMPIHGEYAMLYRHVELAKEVGLRQKNCFIMNNGDILNITSKALFVKGRVPFGNVYVSEKYQTIDLETLKIRKALANNGIIFLILSIEQKDGEFKLIKLPDIVSRGFVHNKQSHELINRILKETSNLSRKYFEEHLDLQDLDDLKVYVEEEICKYLLETTGTKPIVSVLTLKK